MDDRNGTTFIDEDLDLDMDWDLDLDEDDASAYDDATEARVARAFKPTRRIGAYKPKRLGRSANPNWSRIGAALFIAAVFLFLVTIAVKGFLDHRKHNAYKGYFDSVSQIVATSGNQGQELSDLLLQPSGADRAQLIGRLDKLSGKANGLVDQARKLQAPDEMRSTNDWLVTTLEYRRNGLQMLEKAMTQALRSPDAKASAAAVAAANLRLSASDVLYGDSFATNARQVLVDQGVDGVTVPEQKFVKDPDFDSVNEAQKVLERLTSGISPTSGKAVKVPNDGKTRGGSLGGIVVEPSGATLSATGSNEIQGSDNLAFEVSYTNSGEVQSTQVPITVTIKGDQSDAQVLHGSIDSVDPGETATVTIPVKDLPSFGETVSVTIEAAPVPGEKNTGNNSVTFSNVMFKL